jgi:hypothetical protein
MSRVYTFRRGDLNAQPWKNGGGMTCEVASWPPNSTLADFDWRVSIAHIKSSGPFSTFPGVDRVITLLGGSGVVLTAADGSLTHRLDQALQPFAFAGEAQIEADLLGSASDDFNVMTRRATCSARVQVLNCSARLTPASQGLLLACRGRWEVAGHTIAAGEGLWWHDEPCAQALAVTDEDAALLAVLIQPPR